MAGFVRYNILKFIHNYIFPFSEVQDLGYSLICNCSQVSRKSGEEAIFQSGLKKTGSGADTVTEQLMVV